MPTLVSRACLPNSNIYSDQGMITDDTYTLHVTEAIIALLVVFLKLSARETANYLRFIALKICFATASLVSESLLVKFGTECSRFNLRSRLYWAGFIVYNIISLPFHVSPPHLKNILHHCIHVALYASCPHSPC